MDADGMDSGFARVEEPAWRAFVTRAATALELRPGESVFEVGCGAGAFVAPLREAGYAGLEHRYFDRAQVARALRARGLSRVRVEDQAIDGYGNAPFRFNAWGFKEPEPAESALPA